LAHFGHLTRTLAIAAMVLAAVPAIAAEPLSPEADAAKRPKPAPSPTLAESLSLAQAALGACKAKGYNASVTVVDAIGLVRVTLRADGAGTPPVASPLKAAAAAHFNAPGTELEAREQTDPAFKAELAAHKDLYNDHPGSMPLHLHGQVVGGVAIADVPHEIADGCVREAVKAAWPYN
jgi:uncharacterized protein GlcG (DUF336 family)